MAEPATAAASQQMHCHWVLQGVFTRRASTRVSREQGAISSNPTNNKRRDCRFFQQQLNSSTAGRIHAAPTSDGPLAAWLVFLLAVVATRAAAHHLAGGCMGSQPSAPLGCAGCRGGNQLAASPGTASGMCVACRPTKPFAMMLLLALATQLVAIHPLNLQGASSCTLEACRALGVA